MDKKKSQSYNFCYEVLPALFHSQTNQFMEMLNQDGLKFLEFWWDYVGVRLPDDKATSFKSVSFEITPISDKAQMVLLMLPPPKETGEIYFTALISRPEKRFAWVRIPNTRILALTMESLDTYASGTGLGDLTPRGIFVPIGEGPVPTKEAFLAVVQEKIKKPSRR